MNKIVSVVLLTLLTSTVALAQSSATSTTDQEVICKVLKEKADLLNTNSESEFVDEYLKQHPSLFCHPDETVINEAYDKFQESQNEKSSIQGVYERFCKKPSAPAPETTYKHSCI